MIQQLFWLIDEAANLDDAHIEKVRALTTAVNLPLIIAVHRSRRHRQRRYWNQFNRDPLIVAQIEADYEVLQTKLKTAFHAVSMIDVDIEDAAEQFLQNVQAKSGLLILSYNSTSGMNYVLATLEFTRHYPLPVLILTQRPWAKQPKLTVAVDPMHENPRPRHLDEVLINMQQFLRRKLKSQWSVLHCFWVPPALTTYREKIRQLHQESLTEFASDMGVPIDRIRLISGKPENVIGEYVAVEKIDILLIGYVKRNPISQWWLGSTTISLLENPPCDLLLIRGEPNAQAD